VRDALAEHIEVARRLEPLLPQVEALARAVIGRFGDGGRMYTFGNGGSAADAQHLAAELVGRFLRERRPLPAAALSVDPSTVTCISNDYSFDDVFARQVQGLARPGDVVIGFSTSGRSPNVLRGLAAAREVGALTAAFTGGDGGLLEADHVLVAPSATTARIQEMHVLLVHLLVEEIDAWAAS
jgi:D-sedoheptulose 7-phosphate isomerase